MELWREVMQTGWDVPAGTWINIQALVEKAARSRWEEVLREHLETWRMEGGSCFPPDFLDALPPRLTPARFGVEGELVRRRGDNAGDAKGGDDGTTKGAAVLGAMSPFRRPE